MIFIILVIVLAVGYFLFRRFSGQLFSPELPRWFKLLNAGVLLPYLNCLLFKKNKMLGSLIPGLVSTIIFAGVIYLAVSIFSVERDTFAGAASNTDTTAIDIETDSLDFDSLDSSKYAEFLPERDTITETADYQYYLTGYGLFTINSGRIKEKHVYPLTFYNSKIQVDSNNVPLKSTQFYFPEALFPKVEMVWEQVDKSSFEVRPEYIYEQCDTFFIKAYSRFLYQLDEPLLFNKKLDKTVFRFIWMRTFHNPVVIRIENSNNGAFVYWKVTDGQGGYQTGDMYINEMRKLEVSEWESFIALVKRKNFWTIERSGSFGTDGSEWIIEGAEPGRYYATSEWTPFEGSGMYMIGDYLLGLTDLKIEEDKY